MTIVEYAVVYGSGAICSIDYKNVYLENNFYEKTTVKTKINCDLVKESEIEKKEIGKDREGKIIYAFYYPSIFDFITVPLKDSILYMSDLVSVLEELDQEYKEKKYDLFDSNCFHFIIRLLKEIENDK